MLDHPHPRHTRRRQFRYLFTSKHHGGHGDGQWLPSLSEDDEFAVFESADDLDLSDEDGNFFGALPEGDSLRMLGTRHEQIAMFPLMAEGSPWHGYPLWALDKSGPANRRNQKHRPAKGVFDKMVEARLIDEPKRRRLMKGDHI
jgi:hypothetical protein